MRATGIVRRVDDLGRIVIPKEVRRELNIKDGNQLELFIEDGCIVWKKYKPSEGSNPAKNIAEFVANNWHFCPIASSVTVEICPAWGVDTDCCSDCIIKHSARLGMGDE